MDWNIYVLVFVAKMKSWVLAQIWSLLHDSFISFLGHSQYSKQTEVQRLTKEKFPYFYVFPPEFFYLISACHSYFLKIHSPAEQLTETPSGKP